MYYRLYVVSKACINVSKLFLLTYRLMASEYRSGQRGSVNKTYLRSGNGLVTRRKTQAIEALADINRHKY